MSERLVMLIVEDEQVNSEILKRFFEKDYDIYIAINGEDALDIIQREGDVNIILLDILMPVMNGIQFLEKLRQMDGFCDIPVVVNTQDGESENEKKALLLGAADFIKKPYNQDIIKLRVNNVVQKNILERREMQEEIQNAHYMMNETLEELMFRAERDWLTGIYNRETFYKKTTEMIESCPDESYAVIQWNIGKFRIYNELYGTKEGDILLHQMADQFKRLLKGIGTYGRLEADRFVTCISKTEFDKIFPSIKERLEKEIFIGNTAHPVSIHIGIYVATNAFTPIELMCDRAALALQNIRESYLQHTSFYDDKMREVMIKEQALEEEMEDALKEHQFYINLQPIFDPKTNMPVSAEALVRWKHKTLGFISPGEFIPLFERNGFITRLDRFVWEEVCKTIADFKKRGIKIVPISINVSRLNFYDPNLNHVLNHLLKKYHLSPENLKIEITESAYTDNSHQLMEVTNQFRKQGFNILMDDFGSGYSSLNMLKDLIMDTLKIDMMFIRSLESSERAANILVNVVQMAHSLNMDVVAERIETEKQLEFLKNIGCEYIQGYYYSKPLGVLEFEKLMVDSSKL